MDFNSSDLPIELSDAELAAVHGGGLFGWIKRNLVQPVIDYVTGKNNKEPEFNIYSPNQKPPRPVYTVDGQRLA